MSFEAYKVLQERVNKYHSKNNCIYKFQLEIHWIHWTSGIAYKWIQIKKEDIFYDTADDSNDKTTFGECS